MILLNTFGPRLVQQSIERPDWGVESKAGHSESTHFTSHVSSCQHLGSTVLESGRCSTVLLEGRVDCGDVD